MDSASGPRRARSLVAGLRQTLGAIRSPGCAGANPSHRHPVCWLPSQLRSELAGCPADAVSCSGHPGQTAHCPRFPCAQRCTRGPHARLCVLCLHRARIATRAPRMRAKFSTHAGCMHMICMPARSFLCASAHRTTMRSVACVLLTQNTHNRHPYRICALYMCTYVLLGCQYAC